jgi:hypothetical protein
MVNMKTLRRWPCLSAAGLGLVLAAQTGCQTWLPEAALTLPSPHYLEHPPQFIPRSPAFPFIREEATQLAISARAEGAVGPVVAPPPAPVPGVPGPAVLPAPAPGGP